VQRETATLFKKGYQTRDNGKVVGIGLFIQVYRIADGTLINTIGGAAAAVSDETPQSNPPGQLIFPWGLALSGTGSLYVGDNEGHRIHVFDGVSTFFA
jgi:hypothetical protein